MNEKNTNRKKSTSPQVVPTVIGGRVVVEQQPSVAANDRGIAVAQVAASDATSKVSFAKPESVIAEKKVSFEKNTPVSFEKIESVTLEKKVSFEKKSSLSLEKKVSFEKAALKNSAEIKALYDIINSLQGDLVDLKKASEPVPPPKLTLKQKIKRQFVAVPSLIYENLRDNSLNYIISALFAGTVANTAVDMMKADSLDEVKKIAMNMQEEAVKNVENTVSEKMASVSKSIDAVKVLQTKMAATESMVKGNKECYANGVKDVNACLKQHADAFERSVMVSGGGQNGMNNAMAMAGGVGGGITTNNSSAGGAPAAASESSSSETSSSESSSSETSSSESSSSESSSSETSSSESSSSESSSSESSSSESTSSSSSSAAATSMASNSTNNITNQNNMTNLATGDCASNQVTDTALVTLLTNNTMCQTPGTDEPFGAQEQHRSGGELWDYKKGSNDPVDPTSKVGSWSISGSGTGTTVNYSYNGTGGGSYKVYNSSGNAYTLCNGSTPIANVTIISGTSSACF